jgi:NADH dehydrogenase FAD-containing subunit
METARAADGADGVETADVVVLGGGYAGVLAAQRVAGHLGPGARVVLVNAVPHFVERIRLHEVAAGSPPRRKALESLLAGTGAALLVGWAEALDPAGRTVAVRTAEGPRTLRFEQLVYALGSRADTGGLPGAREHAHCLADEAAAGRLHGALAALPPGAPVVVVGAGPTGLELAAEVAERLPHLSVALVSRGPLGEDLSPSARRTLERTLRALGVAVLAGRAAQRVEAEAVVLADGTRLPAAVTVWAGGFTPNPLAQASGLATTPGGQLLVDGALRSVSHPWVFGAGDAMALADPCGAHVRMACATALPLGAHAGTNVVRTRRGEEPLPFGMDFVARCMSLGRQRGLLQVVRGDDTPRDTHLGGWLASRVKEGICRYTVKMLVKEQQRAGSMHWPGEGRPLPGLVVARPLAAAGEA